MKNLLLFFILMVFSCTIASAEYIQKREVLLKKDEQKNIFVKYADKKKLFTFRWTLYTDGALVIFKSYDKIVGQNVLHLRNKNQTFRVELMPKGSKFASRTYLLVKFKEFKEASNEVLFEIFLFDHKRYIKLEELKNS
ncbi:MAG: hypothetical protein PHI38_03750 [Sulfurimonas sp.]|uniref:hypothetical protein n=1 Tax=Sulfurimonas sp. TaxID=2022749 RepID=UPI0026209EB4|nr:hypothetical protein [Sulfurimonas sp.]MDD3475961.1 hypothetical protein [Sulfurimonas sp.]